MNSLFNCETVTDSIVDKGIFRFIPLLYLHKNFTYVQETEKTLAHHWFHQQELYCIYSSWLSP